MNNVGLGIMNATSDVFNAGTFTDLEGPYCSLMPFRTAPTLSSKLKGENQANHGRCILRLFINT
jgi:hypothetical protein